MSRFLPDFTPLFSQIVRIANALAGIDKSLNRIVEIVDQPVKECSCGKKRRAKVKIPPRPLSDHDRTCNCPGARDQRHRHGLPVNADGTDEVPMFGCACERCRRARIKRG